MTDQDTSRTTDGIAAAAPRQRAIEAYDSARERAGDTLGEAPLLALAGGLAAGALIAALLPRTETETRLLRPTARARQGQRPRRRSTRPGYRHAASRRTRPQPREGRGNDPLLLDGLTDAAKASARPRSTPSRNQGLTSRRCKSC